MRFDKTFLSLTLISSMMFSSAAATHTEMQTSSSIDSLTYEQCFPDPYFAELVAHHAGCETSDPVEQEALDRITSLQAFDGDMQIVEDVFDLTGVSDLRNLEEIDLSGLGIFSIPKEIGALEFLRKADFSDNQIVYVSEALGTLDNLEELHLDNNRIEEFPDSLSLLPNLTIYTNEKQDTSLGNVPVRFIPKSRITFQKNGEPVLTDVTRSVPEPRGAGVDLDTLLGNRERSFEEEIMWTPIEELPVYYYEDSYTAEEGAIVQYGSGGELCHVWGNCEYTSNIEQYEVDGKLPNGRFIGNFTEFSQETISARAAYANKQSGRFSTYGDYWPEIPSSCTKPSSGKVPSDSDVNYGDRVGTRDNVLDICDVAVKTANYNSIGYDTTINVTVMASDTNGYGKLSHDMRIRDIMSSRPAAILDIWRWDNPDWFTGKGQSPNNRLFGQKWDENLSFENTDNYFTY